MATSENARCVYVGNRGKSIAVEPVGEIPHDSEASTILSAWFIHLPGADCSCFLLSVIRIEYPDPGYGLALCALDPAHLPRPEHPRTLIPYGIVRVALQFDDVDDVGAVAICEAAAMAVAEGRLPIHPYSDGMTEVSAWRQFLAQSVRFARSLRGISA